MPPRITHLSRDSELNRSKGKLENFISHAVGSNMKSILNRFTSKDSNEGRSCDNPNELEDIRKKPSYRSQNKAEAELARINKTIHWINITAKVRVTIHNEINKDDLHRDLRYASDLLRDFSLVKMGKLNTLL